MLHAEAEFQRSTEYLIDETLENHDIGSSATVPRTPETWDDSGRVRLGIDLVAHQTESLCTAQVRADLRMQALQTQVDLLAEHMQNAAEIAAMSSGQVDGVLHEIKETQEVMLQNMSSQKATLETIEAKHKEDMSWVKGAVTNLLFKWRKAARPEDTAVLQVDRAKDVDANLRTGESKPESDEKENRAINGFKTRSKTKRHSSQPIFETHDVEWLRWARAAVITRWYIWATLAFVCYVSFTLLSALGRGPSGLSSVTEQSPVLTSSTGAGKPFEPQSASMRAIAYEVSNSASMDMADELSSSSTKVEPDAIINSKALGQLTATGVLQTPEEKRRASLELIATFHNLKGFSDINGHDDQGRSLLHLAASSRLSNVARALLEYPDFTLLNAKTNDGKTALHEAAAVGSIEIAELLMGEPRFNEVNGKDRTLQTPLHVAATKGHVGVVRALLSCERFDEANGKDKENRTALLLAGRWGHVGVVRVLLSHKRFTATNSKDKHGRSALHLAAMHGHIKVATAVMSHPNFTEVNAETNSGWTALHYAVASGHLRMTQEILKQGRFNAFNAKNKIGWNALHYAAFKGNSKVAEALLALPSFTDVNGKDTQDATALHVAARYGHAAVAALLIKDKRFTEVNARDKTGCTALHTAARLGGDFHIVEMLLSDERFIETNMPNNDGETAYDIAEREGHGIAADLIQQHLSHLRQHANEAPHGGDS